MPNTLEATLANIPGYGGYLAKKQYDQNQTLSQLQQATVAMSLMQHLQAQSQQQKYQAAQSALGPNATMEQQAQAATPFLGPADVVKNATSLQEHAATVAATKEATAGRLQMMGQQLQQSHEARMSALTNQEDRNTETERHNKIMEPIASALANLKQGQGNYQPMMVNNEPWSFDTKTNKWTKADLPAGAKVEKIAPGAPGAANWTPEAINLAAEALLANPNMQAPYALQRAGKMGEVYDTAAKLAASRGQTAQAAAIQAKSIAADSHSLANITKQYDMVNAFENTVKSNFVLLKKASDEAARSNIPFFDQAILAGEKRAGNIPAAKLYAIAIPVVAEYAKVLEGNTGSSGASVESRRLAAQTLAPFFSQGQIDALIPWVEQEMGNRTNQLAAQRQSIKTRMVSGANVAPASPATPTIEKGVSKSGKAMHKENGNWVYD